MEGYNQCLSLSNMNLHHQSRCKINLAHDKYLLCRHFKSSILIYGFNIEIPYKRDTLIAGNLGGRILLDFGDLIAIHQWNSICACWL